MDREVEIIWLKIKLMSTKRKQKGLLVINGSKRKDKGKGSRDLMRKYLEKVKVHNNFFFLFS